MLLVDEGVDEEEGSIRADEDDGSVDGADEDNGNDGADKEKERADEEEERADDEVGSTGDVDNEASAERSDNGDDADAGNE